MVKNLPDNTGDTRDAGLILGSGRYPAEGNGTPFQYSCLGNSMGKRACRLQSIGLQRVGYDWVAEHQLPSHLSKPYPQKLRRTPKWAFPWRPLGLPKTEGIFFPLCSHCNWFMILQPHPSQSDLIFIWVIAPLPVQYEFSASRDLWYWNVCLQPFFFRPQHDAWNMAGFVNHFKWSPLNTSWRPTNIWRGTTSWLFGHCHQDAGQPWKLLNLLKIRVALWICKGG